MATDSTSRAAARTATLVALPVAVLAGILVFVLFRGGGTSPPPAPPTTPRATGPVEMAAPPLDGRAEVVCRALLSQLPDHIRDLEQRPVTAGSEQNAAFGEPPITLACGVPAPTVEPTADVWRLDGVCWTVEAGAEVSVWTTVDREVPVRVTLPQRYEAPGQWAIEFSGPLIATVPSVDDVPGGCRP